jgi:hypothetical protein
MKNLLQETLSVLQEHGKTKEDVLWCGSGSFGHFSWEVFEKLADVEYDENDEVPHVASDLLIVGKDFWLERNWDMDTWFEEWEYRVLPKKPDRYNEPITLIGDRDGYKGLEKLNYNKE